MIAALLRRTLGVPGLIALACASDSSSSGDSTENVSARRLALEGSAWVKTDLRAPSFEQLRLAAAKLVATCSGPRSRPIGHQVSALLLTTGSMARLPDDLASRLACALDAPAGTPCTALTACAQGDGTAPDPPVCDGDAVRAGANDGHPVAIHCPAQGGNCYSSEIGAFCGTGLCAPGETRLCNGDTVVECVLGVRKETRCGRGFACGTDAATGIVDCVPTQATPCGTTPRCDGAEAVNCVTVASGATLEHSLDCSEYGFECALAEPGVLPGKAVCVPPSQKDCSPSDKATCDGDKLSMCVNGKVWSTSCAELGRTGKCVPSGGAAGEASCAQ